MSRRLPFVKIEELLLPFAGILAKIEEALALRSGEAPA
jgi:hypothetical protein